MINSIPVVLATLANERFRNLLNLRLEILSSFGMDYFRRRSKDIYRCFKNCVVIMDNMNTKLFGGEEANHQGFLGKDTTKEVINELNLAIEKDREKLARFTKLIQRLVADHPDILFILRPHPISSIKEWYANIGDHRNLTIIYKDTAEPWILSSSLVLHAGCTTGLQASFLNTQTVDITKLISNENYQSISTSLSKPAVTYEELSSNVTEATRNKITKSFSSINVKSNDNDPYDHYKDMVLSKKSDYTSSIAKINSLLRRELQFSLESTLVEGIETCNRLHSHKRKTQVIEEANLLANLVSSSKNYRLPMSKVSFINETEIGLRIKDAAITLNVPTPQWRYSSTKRILVVAGGH